MFRRSFVLGAALLAALTVALAGCGGSDAQTAGSADSGTTAKEEAKAAVLVTRECGKEVIVAKSDVPAGQTAMQALDRVADVETDSGGKFVTEIEGIAQDETKKLAWLYYINGKAAQKGATEIKLRPGDVEWWDLHNYEAECTPVPAEAR